MIWLTYIISIAFPVVIAYRLLGGQLFKPRGIVALAFAVFGFLTLFEGFNLARMEDARARHGHVASGWVVERFSSLERDGTRSIGTRGGRDQARRLPIVTGVGFMPQERLARLIATGSPYAWVVEYEYPCDAPRCGGRDFVTEAMWSQLHFGSRVNVRAIDGERYSGRLDDNPQWIMALIELCLGAGLLFAARLMSGVPLSRGREWITAPAVVLRVEPVTYPDATRWRIHFAYFDPTGQAQESVDEVARNTWKSGDDCLAVFRPKSPDLATLRPLDTSASG